MGAAAVVYADPALGKSITISDKNYSGSALGLPGYDASLNHNGPGGYGDHEDQETETNPQTYTDQKWDLEGMYLNGTTLSLVGGFNFLQGESSGGHLYKPGDIFFDVTGDAQYGIGATVAPRFGYEYVMHFSYTNGKISGYNVYAVTSAGTLNSTTDVASSNPWTYTPGHSQTSLAAGTPTYGQLTDVSHLTTWGTTSGGLLGGTHNYLSVDVSFLPKSTQTIFHYTMQCGNDNLMGKAWTVPDGSSTLVLLVGALAGLVGFRRRLRA